MEETLRELPLFSYYSRTVVFKNIKFVLKRIKGII